MRDESTDEQKKEHLNHLMSYTEVMYYTYKEIYLEVDDLSSDFITAVR